MNNIPKVCKECLVLPVCLSKELHQTVHNCSILNRYMYLNTFSFEREELQETPYSKIKRINITGSIEVFGKVLYPKAISFPKENPRYTRVKIKYDDCIIGDISFDCAEYQFTYERRVL